MKSKSLIVACSAALAVGGSALAGLASAAPAYAAPATCTHADVLIVDRNADLTSVSVMLAPGSTADCDVSLQTYQTDGATWATSGNQVQVGFATVHLTDQAQILSATGSSCFGQNDLVIGSTAFAGADAPHYPNQVFGSSLLATWNGGQACATADPTPTSDPSSNPTSNPTNPGGTGTTGTTAAIVPVVQGEQFVAPVAPADPPAVTTPVVSPAAKTTSGALPFTGEPITTELAIAAGLILVGGTLAAVSRRRRSSASRSS